jgi:glycosyltransferase involved in cell wall biosynthesis
MVSEHASPLAALGGVDAGGQNVHVAALATGLARRGVEVCVHTRRDDPRLARRVPLAPGVEVDHIDAGPAQPVPKDALLPHMPAFTRALAAAWREDPPDVVHSHFWMSGMCAVRAAAAIALPVVHTFHALGVVKRRHQGGADTSPPQRIGWERAVMQEADRIVATCTDEVFELVRLGADLHSISVIPCGVDLDLFRPDGPAETPGERPRIVVVSRMVERKGIGTAISALARLPGAQLVVAGGPPKAQLDEDAEARRLAALARAEGVDGRVDLRGRVERDRLPELLRSADAVACVPWYEPFGIVPLEAMACGRPVVASTVGGLIDTVVDGVTGLHVPPRRPDRVAAALRRLLGDDDLRRSLGEAGVRRARERYTWDAVAGATLAVYEQVLARGAGSVRGRRRTGTLA